MFQKKYLFSIITFIALFTSLYSYSNITDFMPPWQHITGWLKSITQENSYFKIVLEKNDKEYVYFVTSSDIPMRLGMWDEDMVTLAHGSPEQKEYFAKLNEYISKKEERISIEENYRNIAKWQSADSEELYISYFRLHFRLQKMKKNKISLRNKKLFLDHEENQSKDQKMDALISYLHLLPAFTFPYYEMLLMLQNRVLPDTLKILKKNIQENPYILLQYDVVTNPVDSAHFSEQGTFIRIKNIEKIVPLHTISSDPTHLTAELIAWNAYRFSQHMKYIADLFLPPIASVSVFSNSDQSVHIVDEYAFEELKKQGGKGQYHDARITKIEEHISKDGQLFLDKFLIPSVDIPNIACIIISENGEEIPVYTNDLSLIEFAKSALKSDIRITALTFKSEKETKLLSLGLSFEARLMLGYDAFLLSAISSRTKQPQYDLMTSAFIENIPEKEEVYRERAHHFIPDKERHFTDAFRFPRKGLNLHEPEKDLVMLYQCIAEKMIKFDRPDLKTYQINQDHKVLSQMFYGLFYKEGFVYGAADEMFQVLSAYCQDYESSMKKPLKKEEKQ